MNPHEYKLHLDRLKNDPEYLKEHKRKQELRIKEYWMELNKFESNDDVPELPNPLTEFYIKRLIELGAIPKSKLQDGIWYYGDYRRASFGKWSEEDEKFHIYRWKFGWRKDECNHFEDDDGFALFVPLRVINEDEKLEIQSIEKEYNETIS